LAPFLRKVKKAELDEIQKQKKKKPFLLEMSLPLRPLSF